MMMRYSFKFAAMTALVGVLSGVVGLNETAFAQEMKPNRERTLTVTGKGVSIIPTNRTRIQLGVEVDGQTAGAVQAEIAAKTNAIIKRLQQEGVERLQTTNITINPKIVYENSRQRQEGFTGRSDISFVTVNPKAGMMLDAAISAGANRVEQVSFLAPEAEVLKARNAALQEASKDALDQADAVLSAMNLRRISIRSIELNPQRGYSPMMVQNAVGFSRDSNSSMSIVGGDQRVEATVMMKIAY